VLVSGYLFAGGSTATGSLAIQFMKLAGYKVATTCSPKNFDFVRSRGADEVLDYKDPECGAKIRELTGNKLRYAWDTVGESAKVCEAALGEGEGRYGTILYNDDFTREGVKQTMTLMYTMFGESFRKYDMEFPASEEDWEFAKRWMGLTERLVGEGKVRPHPKRVGSGGLEGILAGLEELKEERVSGEKLVYRI
jgi:NADPH:quinone reductase-like Zn-dependent oxidoreductase